MTEMTLDQVNTRIAELKAEALAVKIAEKAVAKEAKLKVRTAKLFATKTEKEASKATLKEDKVIFREFKRAFTKVLIDSIKNEQKEKQSLVLAEKLPKIQEILDMMTTFGVKMRDLKNSKEIYV